MIPERSSGRLWTEEEEEQLRVAYITMVEAMPGRSEAAVFTRLERIRVNDRSWPIKPLGYLSRGQRIL